MWHSGRIERISFRSTPLDHHLEVARGLGNTIIYTVEAERIWYEEAAKAGTRPRRAFTIYDRFDLVPIGTPA